jgi:hypothetical protein
MEVEEPENNGLNNGNSKSRRHLMLKQIIKSQEMLQNRNNNKQITA